MKPSWGFVGGSPTGADFWYRMHLPAVGLTRRGVRAEAVSTCAQVPGGALAIQGPRDSRPHVPDVLVLKQITTPAGPAHNEMMLRLIGEARAAGQMVLYDCDADMWHPPPIPKVRDREGKRIPVRQRRTWAQDETHYAWVRVATDQMAACSGIIAANEVLARVIRAQLPEAQVRVVGPSIDYAGYARANRHRARGPHRPLRLGWMGSTDYRGPDLLSIAGPLESVLERFKDYQVEFWYLGHVEGCDTVEELLPNLPAPIVTKAWVDTRDLPAALAELDICVVPQIPSEWAEARSITAGLALAAAGVPAFHSQTENYTELAERGACAVVPVLEAWEPLLHAMIGMAVFTPPAFAELSGRVRAAVAGYDCAHVAAGYEDLVEVVGV